MVVEVGGFLAVDDGELLTIVFLADAEVGVLLVFLAVVVCNGVLISLVFPEIDGLVKDHFTLLGVDGGLLLGLVLTKGDIRSV